MPNFIWIVSFIGACFFRDDLAKSYFPETNRITAYFIVIILVPLIDFLTMKMYKNRFTKRSQKFVTLFFPVVIPILMWISSDSICSVSVIVYRVWICCYFFFLGLIPGAIFGLFTGAFSRYNNSYNAGASAQKKYPGFRWSAGARLD